MLYIWILLINYHLKNTHKPSFLLLCLTTGFQRCIFLIYVHIFEAFSLSSTSHSKQMLELATLPTDRHVKRVYSNMLTSTKSTEGEEAADVSQEEEEDEGLHSSSQAPPQLSCKHEPSFFTYEKTVKAQ